MYYSQQSRVTVKWCKSPTVKGKILENGFREPTNYMRAVARLDPVGQTVDGKVYTGCVASKPSYTYYGEGRAFVNMAYGGVNFQTMRVSIDASIVNRAIVEALGKVQNQKVNLGEALGESMSTLRMIADRMRTLWSIYRNFRRGNFREIAKDILGRTRAVKTRYRSRTYYSVVLNGRRHVYTRKGWETYVEKRWKAEPNSLYLEWMYGWLPLLSDIYGGIEQLQTGFREKAKIFSVVREVKDPINISEFCGATTGYSRATGGSATASCKVKLFGAVRSNAHDASALGLTNPVSVAWALVGFSFVVDWIIPVGAWLDHFTATLGVDFVGGCRTDTIQAQVFLERTNIYCSLPIQKDNWEAGGSPPTGTVNVFAMQRYKYGSWPWAGLYLKNPFSMQHIANAVSLWRSTRKK